LHYEKLAHFPETVINSLITMYAKCGDLNSAKAVSFWILSFDFLSLIGVHIFEEYLPQHAGEDPVVTWNAMIQAYSIHGYGKLALELFNVMQQQNVKPNTITFCCLLNGCSHSLMVDQVWDIYNSMKEKYGIIPTQEHHACIVDILGRAGKLEEAENFIHDLPQQSIVLWQTLLGASRNHRDVQRAQRAADQILKLDSSDASTYVLLANTYGTSGLLEERSSIWQNMTNQNIKKIPGITWVTINGKTESFYVDSRNHPYPSP
jgi:pentatricopeptide repeat protein